MTPNRHRTAATIEFDGVCKWFDDVVAVSDVTLSIGPGVTALLGPNGAGKSTMLRLLCGLTDPSRGTVGCSASTRGRRDVLRRIGLVPQQEAVLDRLTGRMFVGVAARLQRPGRPRPRRGRRRLELVELDPADTRPLKAYSKGMRQRVKVAAAIVHEPELIVLDEPLDGLDPRQRLRMIELFARLGDEGRSVVVSSHVLDEVERFGSRVIVVGKGRLAAEGDFREIRDLMDDRPHRLRVGTDKPRQVAAGLLGRRRRARRAVDRSARCSSTPKRCSRSATRWPPSPGAQRRPAAGGRPARRRPRQRVPLPGGASLMGTVFRLILRMQVTRGRAVGLGALGALAVLLAIAVRSESSVAADRLNSMFNVVDGLGLGVLTPVVALVFASAALGDLAEDRTLVYVWLRPVDRWRITLGALAATLCAALPFVLVPFGVGVLIAGVAADLLVPTLLSASIAVFAYSTIFLGLGLRVKRALVWGLVYVVVWEGAVARAARGAARLSVQVYGRSLLAEMVDHLPPRQAASTVASVVVPLAVAVAAWIITTRWLGAPKSRKEPPRSGSRRGGSRRGAVITLFCTRMQPWLTERPMLPGALVPWRPTSPSPLPNFSYTSECADKPNTNGP